MTRLLYALSALSVAVLAACLAALQLPATGTAVPADSASPLNQAPLGSSTLAGLLAGHGYRVALGGVDTVAALAKETRVVYIVVGPDKPFTEDEASVLGRLVRIGKVSLLLADELGVVNSLAGALGTGRVAGGMPTADGSPVVELECMGRRLLSTKVSQVVGAGPEARVLCTGPGGEPVAVLTRHGDGLVLLVADSSMFTNILLGGAPPFAPTAGTVLDLVGELAGPGTAVVLDTAHYSYAEKPGPGSIALLPMEAVLALTVLLHTLASKHPLLAVVALPLLAAWAAIVLLEREEAVHG
ncbi:DUF4350 domain-containing protein [Pyrodictium abyssi]|uniref:DUF4350 domain-containing protein n=1 Tax=Pyrodictium abyssi TaxID=54256 RepID=A0ABN6ZJM4_9CREN|nr:hypothetical protein PABY_00270 [Pyrodictium abyssi]